MDLDQNYVLIIILHVRLGTYFVVMILTINSQTLFQMSPWLMCPENCLLFALPESNKLFSHHLIHWQANTIGTIDQTADQMNEWINRWQMNNLNVILMS